MVPTLVENSKFFVYLYSQSLWECTPIYVVEAYCMHTIDHIQILILKMCVFILICILIIVSSVTESMYSTSISILALLTKKLALLLC